MKKTIGILGGMGPLATADLLIKITTMTKADCDNEHIRVYIDSDCAIPDRTGAILNGGPDPVPEMTSALRNLEACGADCVIMACNTAHFFLPRLQPLTEIPILDMPSITARRCAELFPGKKAALLGTTGTLQTGLYNAAMEEAGVPVLLPEPEEQAWLMHLIYDIVKATRPMQPEEQNWSRLLADLRGRGADYFILACVLGLIVANLFKGSFPVLELQEGAAYEAKSANLMDTIVNIFPNNFINPLSTSAMLQIIFIAIIFGCGVLVAGEKGKPFGDFISSFNEVTQRVMSFILELSPYGVFALMVWVVAAQGPKILGSLGLVLLAAYIGYILHTILVYSLSVKIFADMSPLRFFKKIFPAAAFAFTSTSSVATLPITKECCDEMDVHNEISSFVLPLGATVNMDGTAIYQCVAAIFLAKCIGVDLTLTQMIIIVVTATLASIGTAGTSGAGMIMLAMVLDAVGIPPTYIGIIYGIDRLFDMGRTTLNIIGDASCAVCVNHWESKKESKNAA